MHRKISSVKCQASTRFCIYLYSILAVELMLACHVSPVLFHYWSPTLSNQNILVRITAMTEARWPNDMETLLALLARECMVSKGWLRENRQWCGALMFGFQPIQAGEWTIQLPVIGGTIELIYFICKIYTTDIGQAMVWLVTSYIRKSHNYDNGKSQYRVLTRKQSALVCQNTYTYREQNCYNWNCCTKSQQWKIHSF